MITSSFIMAGADSWQDVSLLIFCVSCFVLVASLILGTGLLLLRYVLPNSPAAGPNVSDSSATHQGNMQNAQEDSEGAPKVKGSKRRRKRPNTTSSSDLPACGPIEPTKETLNGSQAVEPEGSPQVTGNSQDSVKVAHLEEDTPKGLEHPQKRSIQKKQPEASAENTVVECQQVKLPPDKKKEAISRESLRSVLQGLEETLRQLDIAFEEKVSSSKAPAPLPANSEIKTPLLANSEIQNQTKMVVEEEKKAPQGVGKTREHVKAEREAKKLAKQAAKQAAKDGVKINTTAVTTAPQPSSQFTVQHSEQEAVNVPVKNHVPINGDQAVNEGPSKAELRAQRRAKQEAQRAQKAQQNKHESAVVSKAAEVAAKPEKKDDVKPKPKAAVVKAIGNKTKVSSAVASSSALYAHLRRQSVLGPTNQHISAGHSDLHPSILRLGLGYYKGTVRGSNARCLALVSALQDIVRDYHTPPHCDLARDLESHLEPQWHYLDECRQVSVSMASAFRYARAQIRQVPPGTSDVEAKEKLAEKLDAFVRESIELAGTAIAMTAAKKIRDGDVILVYACSSLVIKVLSEARRQGRQFRAVVLDSRPLYEGREMLRRLIRCGVPCWYGGVAAASHLMPQATKVLLGAHALLANGWVMARTGASQLALLAKAANVPVLVCCETYKFCERVQTDAFVFNELGDASDLLESDSSQKGSFSPCLQVLAPMYDVTPPELISAVVTELAVLPCTSVPVVLRVKQTDSTF